jgi:hypothetical protein
MNRCALLSLLALTACQAPPQGNAANGAEQASAPVKQVETLPPDETAVVEKPDGKPVLVPASTKIPESLQGRWGLVPADCTSTRGDAKGLLTVGADTLVFYESRARLQRIASAAPDRLVGAFAFTGEGQNWTRTETLELKDGALLRSDEEVSTPLRYSRCS